MITKFDCYATTNMNSCGLQSMTFYNLRHIVSLFSLIFLAQRVRKVIASRAREVLFLWTYSSFMSISTLFIFAIRLITSNSI